MRNCIFVQVRCKPGQTYAVADRITEKEIHSEMYSTSGDYDLMIKIYVPENNDIGRFVNDNVSSVDGVERTLTTLTFNAF